MGSSKVPRKLSCMQNKLARQIEALIRAYVFLLSSA